MNLKQLLESVDESKVVKFSGGSGLLFIWTADEEPKKASQSNQPVSSSREELFSSLPDVLTIEEMANALKIGRSSAYEMIRRNDIYHFKIGRTIRISKKALIEWIESGGDK